MPDTLRAARRALLEQERAEGRILAFHFEADGVSIETDQGWHFYPDDETDAQADAELERGL